MIFHLHALEARRLLATGALDPTFGTAGRTSLANAVNVLYASAVQPDGKVVLAGAKAVAGGGTDISVARLNPDATLDATFGATGPGQLGGGVLTVPFDGNADVAYGVTLTPEGAILVVGGFANDVGDVSQDYSLGFIIKLTPLGRPDDGFGDSGLVTLNLSSTDDPGISSELRGVAVQPDGKVVVVGSTNLDLADQEPAFALARLDADGSRDASFGDAGNGVEVQAFAGVFAKGFAVALEPGSENIVFTGTAINPSEDASRVTGEFVVGRLTPAGVPDSTFGQGGYASTAFPSIVRANGIVVAVASALAVQPDGRILAAGTVNQIDLTTGDGAQGVAVARYNTDGSADGAFGVGGVVTTYYGKPTNPTAQTIANQISLQADGRFYVAGRAAVAPNTTTFGAVSLTRFNPDGSLDKTFNKSGKFLLAPSGPVKVSGASLISLAPRSSPQDAFSDVTAKAGATVAIVPGGGILLLASQDAQVNVARLIPDGPDLTPRINAAKPATYISGNTARLTISLSNQGSLPFSTSLPIGLALLGGPATLPITVASIPVSIKPGTTRPLTLTFQLPAVQDDATLTFQVTLIPDHAAPDGDYLNNTATAGVAIRLRPAFVEVSATVVALPASPLSAGAGSSFAVRLINMGTLRAAGTLVLQLLASADAVLSDDDVRLFADGGAGVTLLPGKPVTLRLRAAVPAGTVAGMYALLLRVDASALAARNAVQTTVLPGFLTIR